MYLCKVCGKVCRKEFCHIHNEESIKKRKINYQKYQKTDKYKESAKKSKDKLKASS